MLWRSGGGPQGNPTAIGNEDVPGAISRTGCEQDWLVSGSASLGYGGRGAAGHGSEISLSRQE